MCNLILPKKEKKAIAGKKAEEKYQSAIRLNPFNAAYFAKYGDFLRWQSRYRKDKVACFKQAEELYKRALRFNPRWAACYARLGKVRIEIISVLSELNGREKTSYNDIVRLAMMNFRTAFQNDPKGFDTAYSIGYAGISIWAFLDENEKELVLDRIRYVLELRPWYDNYIFPYVWEYTKDSKVLHSIVPDSGLHLIYSEKEKDERARLFHSLRGLSTTEISEWKGKSRNGKNKYKNGCMH